MDRRHFVRLSAAGILLPSFGFAAPTKKKVIVKVGMIGDSRVGKTSLMRTHVDGTFPEDYVPTLGTDFDEKQVSLRKTDITFSFWDIGGDSSYRHMLPLICNDAAALMLCFSLADPASLDGLRKWHTDARKLNDTARAFLVGCGADLNPEPSTAMKVKIAKAAKAMNAPYLQTSAATNVGVSRAFATVAKRTLSSLRPGLGKQGGTSVGP